MVFGNLFNIAKNPILRYLSKFAKNLSPEHLKLSFVKGEGELTNLELNEEAIMQLLDLPTWLRLRSARCNRVSIRCQWTKLRKQPLCLSLDEVEVEIEALDTPRPQNGSDTASYKDKASDGRYGFADKVIDGIDLCVNSVVIVFRARAFRASIQLSRVHLYSVLPTWNKGELKFTYLRSRERDQILLFKEVVWETTRFEAGNSEDCGATLVRLITNTSRIRLTIKKNLADCRIVASRLELLLDDLLWVLTVSQLEATVLFVKSLQKSVEKSVQQSKQQAKKKLEQTRQPSGHRLSQASALSPAQQLQQQRESTDASSAAASEIAFRRFDILETSYHLHTGRVDLHFCEESGSDSKLSESSVVNGAIQLTLLHIRFQLYPLHPFESDRSERWLYHTDVHEKADQWHKQRVANLGAACLTDQLIESCVTISLQDFCMACVTSTDASKNKKAPFLASDKAILQLPKNTITGFVDFTEFFYPVPVSAAAPLPCLYAHFNPLHLRLDFETLIWLNAFNLSLSKNLATSLRELNNCHQASQLQIQSATSSEPMFILAECVLPRLLIPAKQPTLPQQQQQPLHLVRPTVLEAQASCVTISNDPASFSDALSAAVASGVSSQQPDSCGLSSAPDFPGDPSFDWMPFSIALAEAAAAASPPPPSSIWHVTCPQLWCDFVAEGSSKPRRQHCLDAGRVDAFLSAGSAPDSFAVLLDLPADSGRELRLALTHLQYLFLLRMGEDFSSFADCMQRDRRGMGLPEPPPGPVAAVWLPIPCARLQLLLGAVAATAGQVDSSAKSPRAIGSATSSDTCSVDSDSCDPRARRRLSAPTTGSTGCGEEAARASSANGATSMPPTSGAVEFVISGASSSPSTTSTSPPTAAASPKMTARQSQQQQQQQQISAPQLLVERFRQMTSSKHRGSATSLDSGGSEIGDEWERVSVSSDDLSVSEDRARRLQLLEEAEAAAAAAAEAGGCLLPTGAIPAASSAPASDDEDETTGGGCVREPQLACLTGGLLGASVLVTVDHAGSLVRVAARQVGLAEPGTADDATGVTLSEALTARPPRVNLLDSDAAVDANSDLSPSRLRIRVFVDEARTPDDPRASEVCVRLSGLAASAGLSALTGLGDFFEDELLQPALPMRLLLEAVRAEIVEDRPCLNATCPGEHLPLRLELPNSLSLLRGVDNVMRIQVDPAMPGSSTCGRCLLQQQQQQQQQPAEQDLAAQLARCQAELAAVEALRDSLRSRVSDMQKQLGGLNGGESCRL